MIKSDLFPSNHWNSKTPLQSLWKSPAFRGKLEAPKGNWKEIRSQHAIDWFSRNWTLRYEFWMFEMSNAVLQILKGCLLKIDAAVRWEQLSYATSNLAITQITQLIPLLGHKRPQSYHFHSKSLLSCMQTHPSFYKFWVRNSHYFWSHYIWYFPTSV